MDRFAEFQGSSFLSWMFTIAENLAVDGFRKRNKRVVSSLERVPPPWLEVDPSRGLLNEEIRQQLGTCLQDLTDDQRQLVLARYIEGLSGDVLMARLGIAARGTLDSRHGRALEALKKCMEGGSARRNVKNPRRGAKT